MWKLNFDINSEEARTQKVVLDSRIISIGEKSSRDQLPGSLYTGGKKYAVGITVALSRRYYWSF